MASKACVAIAATASLMKLTLAQDGNSPSVWGSVAIINNGERTPDIAGSEMFLTPQGAQQMIRQGQAFRSRYLEESDADDAVHEPINGIDKNALNNAQLTIKAVDDEYIVAGGLAFMQGLYPPNADAFLETIDGLNVTHNTSPSDDESTEYPLDGYQYPLIQTVATVQEAALPLQGNIACNRWSSAKHALRDDPSLSSLHSSTQSTLETFFTRPPFAGTVPPHRVNLWQSYSLWDFARFQINHNQTVYDGMQDQTFPTSSVDNLKQLATDWQLALNTDSRSSRANTDDPIRTVAGNTLAHGVLDALGDLVALQGRTSSSAAKLTLFFTTFEPMLAFSSLARLRTPETNMSDSFGGLPDPAAAMAFELVGDQPGEFGQFPDADNLWLRFVYRGNSSDDEARFEQYSLFSASRGEGMIPYNTFKRQMEEIAMDASSWCEECESSQPFCLARRSSSGRWGNNDGHGGDGPATGAKNPAVAGVIGAVIMLGIMGLLAGGLALFGGFRVQRRKSRDEMGARGFKGGEKMASDEDLTQSKGGVRHERVGSWELRGPQDEVRPGPSGDGDGAGAVIDHGAREGAKVDDDGVSVLSIDPSGAPVKPQESV